MSATGSPETGLTADDERCLAAFFETQSDVRLAYLFGSRARAEAVEGSDYDFGLVCDGPVSLARREEIAAALRGLLATRRVDVVILAEAPIELQYNVVAARRRLFERGVAVRVEYEAKVYSLYCDALPTLRRQRDELIRGEGYARGVQRHRETLAATRRKLAALRGAQRTGTG